MHTREFEFRRQARAWNSGSPRCRVIQSLRPVPPQLVWFLSFNQSTRPVLGETTERVASLARQCFISGEVSSYSIAARSVSSFFVHRSLIARGARSIASSFRLDGDGWTRGQVSIARLSCRIKSKLTRKALQEHMMQEQSDYSRALAFDLHLSSP